MKLINKLLLIILLFTIPTSVFAVNNNQSRLADIEDDEIYWQKSTWKEFAWKTIEETEGEYDWEMTDDLVKDRQKDGKIIVPRIMPFVNWDQDICHLDKDEHYLKEVGSVRMGKPCNMKKYKKWLRKVVERYDNDGINDMPGLKKPIRYWIIGNEPDVECEEEQCFFDITAKGYAKLLKASSKTIKKQSSKNKVIIAAPSTMGIESRKYYKKIFNQGTKKYFDIMNYHAIDPDAKVDILGVRKFNQFIKNNKLKKKKVFAGEWEVGNVPYPGTNKDFKKRIIRSTAYALSHGIDTICFIGGDDYPESSKQILINYFNFADTQKIYKETIKGTQLTVGKYKFRNLKDESDFYVLWGRNKTLPKSIQGDVKVTNKNNKSEIMDSADIVLTADPIIVELL
ncbi:MAG: hypothetical protein ABID45_03030 [Patescibacteria group bacterium]